MSSDMMKQGRIGWYELMTTDVEAAKAFYGELFGWELAKCPMAEIDYTIIKAAGKEIGGMMAQCEEAKAQGAPPQWTGYVSVDDVDATAGKTTTLGGAIIVPPMDIPNVGRFAVIRDPQGATIAIITYTCSCCAGDSES